MTENTRVKSHKGMDRYGFWFWLKWIAGFAASFFAAAALWTGVIRLMVGPIREPELVLTWAISVFGSWFLLLTPFMRKKEEIWKRLNPDESKAVDVWWKGTCALLGNSVLTGLFWSWRLKEAVLSSPGRFDPVWIKSTLVTWAILLIPLLVYLYRKADVVFKDAVIRQGVSPRRYRASWVEPDKRMLPGTLIRSIDQNPFTIPGGHVATLHLRDGRQVPHVFIRNRSEIIGVYDRETIDFSAADVDRIEVTRADDLLPYVEERWLRLDGTGR